MASAVAVVEAPVSVDAPKPTEPLVDVVPAAGALGGGVVGACARAGAAHATRTAAAERQRALCRRCIRIPPGCPRACLSAGDRTRPRPAGTNSSRRVKLYGAS